MCLSIPSKDKIIIVIFTVGCYRKRYICIGKSGRSSWHGVVCCTLGFGCAIYFLERSKQKKIVGSIDGRFSDGIMTDDVTLEDDYLFV